MKFDFVIRRPNHLTHYRPAKGSFSSDTMSAAETLDRIKSLKGKRLGKYIYESEESYGIKGFSLNS